MHVRSEELNPQADHFYYPPHLKPVVDGDVASCHEILQRNDIPLLVSDDDSNHGQHYSQNLPIDPHYHKAVAAGVVDVAEAHGG
jgi:hypothetical protein